MPVIIVGADAGPGRLVDELAQGAAEVRVFVSDPGSGDELRSRGAKVAVGDVSDSSHVGGAALHAFSAVVLGAAARDDRERAFAGDFDALRASWAAAVREAGVTRVIWVDEEEAGPLADAAPEFVHIRPGDEDALVRAVVAANDAASI